MTKPDPNRRALEVFDRLLREFIHSMAEFEGKVAAMEHRLKQLEQEHRSHIANYTGSPLHDR